MPENPFFLYIYTYSIDYRDEGYRLILTSWPYLPTGLSTPDKIIN